MMMKMTTNHGVDLEDLHLVAATTTDAGALLLVVVVGIWFHTQTSRQVLRLHVD